MGIFEFGRAMYTKNSLTNAARAAARAAVVTSNTSNGSANIQNDCSTYTGTNNEAYSAACNSLTSNMRTKNIQFTVTVIPTSPPKSGDMINVMVQWNGYATVVPKIIPQLHNITLQGETAMRYE
jgi:Flp pilus assembly protein TadG